MVPLKAPRLYSGNVITSLSVIFFEKMASCDLQRTLCDFTGILTSIVKRVKRSEGSQLLFYIK